MISSADIAEVFLKEVDPEFNCERTQVRNLEYPYLTDWQIHKRQILEMPVSQFVIKYSDEEYSYEQCLQVVWTKAKNKTV